VVGIGRGVGDRQSPDAEMARLSRRAIVRTAAVQGRAASSDPAIAGRSFLNHHRGDEALQQQRSIKQLVSSAATAALETQMLEIWAHFEKNEPEAHFIAVLKNHLAKAAGVEVEVQTVHWESDNDCLAPKFPVLIMQVGAQRIGVTATLCEHLPESYTGPSRYPQHLAHFLEAQECLNELNLDVSYLLAVLRYSTTLGEDECTARTFHNLMFVDWATMLMQPENLAQAPEEWHQTIQEFGFTGPFLQLRPDDFSYFLHPALGVFGLRRSKQRGLSQGEMSATQIK
jgi:hypothetical protein